MCQICCITLKGACYFGASVHILDALFFIWEFIFDAVHVSYGKYYDPIFSQMTEGIDNELALVGVYYSLLFIAGCVMFRAIESESYKIMLSTGAFHFILQFVAFVVVLVYWVPIPPSYDTYGLNESARIGRFITRVIWTFIYLVTIAIFSRETYMENKEIFFQRH